ELRHAPGAVTVARADAVAAGVAAADDDHVLAVGADLALDGAAGVDLVLLRQELHREVHAVEISPRYWQVARALRAGREDDRVELRHQLIGRDAFLRPVGDDVAFAELADANAGAQDDA